MTDGLPDHTEHGLIAVSLKGSDSLVGASVGGEIDEHGHVNINTPQLRYRNGPETVEFEDGCTRRRVWDNDGAMTETWWTAEHPLTNTVWVGPDGVEFIVCSVGDGVVHVENTHGDYDHRSIPVEAFDDPAAGYVRQPVDDGSRVAAALEEQHD